MKVLAFTESPDHVCYRYRIEAYADALAERGWTLESLPLEPQTFARTGQLRQAALADVVILQRKLLPLWQIRLLRRVARRLIYDFDDALFCRDSYSRKGTASVMRLAHFWATIYAADMVTAGNDYLRDEAAAYVDPERVVLVPTTLNPRLYPLANHQRQRHGVRLVWIGQHSTLPCLDHAAPVLEAAASRLPNLELRVICNRFPRLEGITVVPRPWSAASEAWEVSQADIGVSWLPDDSWSRGKCGLKVLQYMAAGLPVVANPVGMNRTMVRHGENGFLVSTTQQAVEAIERLATSPQLRQAMGQAGRRLVQRDYDSQQWGPVFAELVDALWHQRRTRTTHAAMTPAGGSPIERAARLPRTSW